MNITVLVEPRLRSYRSVVNASTEKNITISKNRPAASQYYYDVRSAGESDRLYFRRTVIIAVLRDTKSYPCRTLLRLRFVRVSFTRRSEMLSRREKRFGSIKKRPAVISGYP